MKYRSIIFVVFLMLISVIGTAQAADVALFYNNTYVDTGDEANNLRATLIFQGHTVTTFTGITATDFNNAVAGQTVLGIPELENGNLNADLNPAARTAIANFVNSGGIFIGFGSSNAIGDYISLVNAVFGFSLSAGTDSSSSYALNASGASGTPFQGGPASLPDLSNTADIAQSSLPSGTKIIYNNGTDVAVFMAPFGSGWVILIGWDWFSALPLGSEDGGWLSVLNSAVNVRPQQTTTAVPTINEWGMIIFMIVAGIGAVYYLRRQRRAER